ncbi:hypothetical protein [Sphingobium xenophagum]
MTLCADTQHDGDAGLLALLCHITPEQSIHPAGLSITHKCPGDEFDADLDIHQT